MSDWAETTDLNAQLAQRLFGWTARPAYGGKLWRDPWGTDLLLPLYTADPHATALVWQWVEESRGLQDGAIIFSYQGGQVRCRITRLNGLEVLAQEGGTTWPEALCRAALALAEALEKGER